MFDKTELTFNSFYRKSGFDLGSEWMLVTCLTHASCTQRNF